MRTRLAGVSGSAFLAVIVAACGGLSHPVSDDGSLAGNPTGVNPGTQILYVNVARSVLMVGDTVSITGTLGGAALQNNGLLQATSSDPSIASVGGPVIFARSVGTVQVDVVYSGKQASPAIGISVIPNSSGSSASVSVQNTAPPAFAPASVNVKVGAIVQFGTGTQHNVTFDNVPGAPQNVPSSSSWTYRTFLVAGSFTYSCTAHGESGVINVVP